MNNLLILLDNLKKKLMELGIDYDNFYLKVIEDSIYDIKNRGENLNKKVLILAGRTEYPIDAVRILTNKSTGLLGYYLTRVFFREGFNVLVIKGKTDILYPSYAKIYEESNPEKILKLALDIIKKENIDIVASPMAVLDFKPEYFDEKIKSDKEEIVIRLRRGIKILNKLKESFPNIFYIKFKAEYKKDIDELIKIARKESKEWNIVIVNDISKITKYEHPAVIGYNGNIKIFKGNKEELAKIIVDICKKLIK